MEGAGNHPNRRPTEEEDTNEEYWRGFVAGGLAKNDVLTAWEKELKVVSDDAHWRTFNAVRLAGRSTGSLITVIASEVLWLSGYREIAAWVLTVVAFASAAFLLRYYWLAYVQNKRYSEALRVLRERKPNES